MARPFPEFTGHRYKVSPTKPVPGAPNTDLLNKRMAVPMGDNPLERGIRAHEMAHAMFTPLVSPEEAKERKIRIDSWHAAEELRVNTLAERAGIPMDALTFESDYQNSKTTIAGGDVRDIARSYCIHSGTGRRVNFKRAWQECAGTLDEPVRKLAEKAFARLDAYADALTGDDAEWGFRVGRYLDALTKKQQELQQQPQPPKQPQPQPQSKDDKTGDGDKNNGEWADVPSWDDEDEDDTEDTDEQDEQDSGDDGDEQEQDDDTTDDDEASESNSDADTDDDSEGDSDSFADGDDEDDPLDGMGAPHCDIEFDELVEAEIRRELQKQAELGARAWATAPTFSIPNPEVNEGAWLEFELNEPERPVQTKNGKSARKPKVARAGRFRRGAQVFVDGGYAFERNRPAPGGTVLVDISGSMGITEEQIETILAAAPGATIAVYNSVVKLTIIVKDGKRVEQLPHCDGFNGIDAPALRWLAEQDGPRVWVSDNFVNGSGGGQTDLMYRECAEICLAARVLRVAPADGYYYYGTRKSIHDGNIAVPASFTGYEQVADALAEYHRRYSK